MPFHELTKNRREGGRRRSILAPAAGWLLTLLLSSPGLAEEAKNEDPEAPRADSDLPASLEERASMTRHGVTIDGTDIRYVATAGNLILRQEDGTPKASIFYIAYEREDAADPADRPLSFCFNGGPGSSSVWLHLGLLGPRRVLMDKDGRPLPPPYRLVDNPASLLDVTDLVFIDPVTTGFSRTAPGEDAARFHGLEGDIEIVGEFIRLWTTRQERWASPKFLVGESYGTTRAAGLARYLQDRQGMYLNGLVLVSSVLDFQTVEFEPGNDLAHLLILPTYAATAWYHGQLDPDLQGRSLRQVLDEVEAFALGDYALALLRGRRLGEKEQHELARRLARYTGLSADYLARSELRVPIDRFVMELLRPRRRAVGRLDSRLEVAAGDAAAESSEFDPSYAAILGPFTATVNDLLRRELAFESDLPYEILTDRVYPWSFAKFEGRFVNVTGDLRSAMARNQDLKVFVANGYFDLATPYFATEYTFDHLGVDPGQGNRITMGHYEAGHMMYIHEQSLWQLRDDLVAFYASAAGESFDLARPDSETIND